MAESKASQKPRSSAAFRGFSPLCRVHVAFNRRAGASVAIDPSLSFGPDSDECGIVACGLLRDRNEAHVIEDGSCRASPQTWARTALDLAHRHQADCVCYEANVGGKLVDSVLRQFDRNARIRAVPARKGKALRAEPVLALYEQGRIKHCGVLPQPEAEMTGWEPDGRLPSPNRLDALVYAVTELLIRSRSRLAERRPPAPRLISRGEPFSYFAGPACKTHFDGGKQWTAALTRLT
jgi:phage terminase large subunit-like protein